MAILVDTRTGPVVQADGAGDQPLRQSRMGSLVTTEGHGRFWESASRGFMFSTGSNITALSANTITTTAATPPILGVWNPLSSTINVVLLQCYLTAVANTLTSPAGPGAFVWAVATGQSAISTGTTPYNRKTLAQSGSQAKGFGATVALTGLSGSLTIIGGAGLPSPG